MKLVTPQTGEEGRIVQRLLIEEGLDIKRELYLSILVDRAIGAPVFMASTAGGMEIEEVAQRASGSDSARDDRSRDRLAAVITRARWLSAWAFRGELVDGRGAIFAVALPRVHRNRRFAGRNQSAAS